MLQNPISVQVKDSDGGCRVRQVLSYQSATQVPQAGDEGKYRVFGFINFSFQLPMFIFSDCKSLVHTKKSTLADAHTLKNKK
jgi:hypothetical protein